MIPHSPSNVVLTQRFGHTLVITINRPDARNSVNIDVHRGIGAAMEEAESNIDIRAVVLTGAGDRAFCAGADLKAVARGEPLLPEDDPRVFGWGFGGYVEHYISKPTIAAINGAALGGGAELVLASDLAVASTTATIGLPEVKRGVLAAAGGAFRLPKQIPQKIAMRMLLTGESISAQQALEWGLINEVVAPGEVLDAALALAERINVNAPISVQATKLIVNGIIDGKTPGEDDAWDLTLRLRAQVRRSEDFAEGPRAFAEGRAPRWTGR